MRMSVTDWRISSARLLGSLPGAKMNQLASANVEGVIDLAASKSNAAVTASEAGRLTRPSINPWATLMCFLYDSTNWLALQCT